MKYWKNSIFILSILGITLNIIGCSNISLLKSNQPQVASNSKDVTQETTQNNLKENENTNENAPKPLTVEDILITDNEIHNENTVSDNREIAPNTDTVKKYCEKIQQSFEKYSWGKSNCELHKWNHVRNSVLGTPLIWKVYGEESEESRKNITMIMCGVHGDEITPIKFCFDILEDLDKNPQIIGENNLVIVAPIVNPDSFFKAKPTRTNARGIDINRNFPTKDWYKNALRLWKTRYGAQKRRYPGKNPLSEPEVLFQVNLIKRYDPNKVISVHSPLTMLDYDGPVFGSRESSQTGEQAKDLLIKMSEKASGYKISNYPFFTGSLGNYAGNENQIPTYTLELPNSDWTKTDQFWKRFKPAIHHAIEQDFRKSKVSSNNQLENNTLLKN